MEIAPKVYAVYGHLQPESLRVKVGDTVKVGEPLAKIGNTGPSLGPHLHFGLLNRPDMFTGRSLPFVIDSYTLAGTVDFKASQGDTVAVISNSKQVRSVTRSTAASKISPSSTSGISAAQSSNIRRPECRPAVGVKFPAPSPSMIKTPATGIVTATSFLHPH